MLQSLLTNLTASTTAAFVTAVATAALFFATIVLARETRRMADRSAQPHVVATIEFNQWTLHHADVKVANTGNAAAYDINIRFSPELPPFSEREKTPFQTISVLRPGQELVGHVNRLSKFSENYTVSIDWLRLPSDTQRETLVYKLNIEELKSVARLGAPTPFIQMADEIKKIREDIHSLASGMHRLAVNSYSNEDREREYEERMKLHDELKAKEGDTSS